MRQFNEFAIRTLRDHLNQISRCINLLGDEQAWSRVNERCNSAGNLMLHLNGNVRQWIVTGLGGVPFDRNRPGEFNERGPIPGGELLARLKETVALAGQVTDGLDDAALERVYAIQSRQISGVEAVFHVVEHFAFHTGQIIQMTKAMLNIDLSLYDEHGKRK